MILEDLAFYTLCFYLILFEVILILSSYGIIHSFQERSKGLILINVIIFSFSQFCLFNLANEFINLLSQYGVIK